MKKTVLAITVAAAVTLTLGGCRRHYQMNYAHVAVDTLQHNDVDSVEDIYEEHLYDIPDAPGEVTVDEVMSRKSRQAAREAEKMFSGEE